MIQLAIVDDDPVSVRTIHSYINRFYKDTPEACHVTEFRDGADLIRDYRSVFDIIFMDVEMEQSNGIHVARFIRERDSRTVILFISRMAKYAVAGYDVSALDYILKPVDYYSFEMKLRKALHYLEAHQEKKIQISLDGSFVWLSTDEIQYIEVYGHRLVYHTATDQYEAGGSINALLKELEPYHFVQCSRYCIVNLRHVGQLRDNDLTVGGITLQVSKRRRKDLVDALMLYFGGRA